MGASTLLTCMLAWLTFKEHSIVSHQTTALLRGGGGCVHLFIRCQRVPYRSGNYAPRVLKTAYRKYSAADGAIDSFRCGKKKPNVRTTFGNFYESSNIIWALYCLALCWKSELNSLRIPALFKLGRAYKRSENVRKKFRTLGYCLWEEQSLKFVMSMKNLDSIDSVCDVLATEYVMEKLCTSFAPIYWFAYLQ